jgi:hypothetical protein
VNLLFLPNIFAPEVGGWLAKEWYRDRYQRLGQNCCPLLRGYLSMSSPTTYSWHLSLKIVGIENSVVVETRKGLDGPGIESLLEARFPTFLQTSPGSHPSSYTMCLRFFLPGVNRPERVVNQPSLSKAEAKERVELRFYPHSGPSCPLLGRNLIFTFLTLLIFEDTWGHSSTLKWRKKFTAEY